MDVLISGQAGIAVLIQGDTVTSYSLDEPEFSVPQSSSALPYLLADATDVLEFKELSLSEIHSQLDTAWRKDRILQLTLILLDAGDEPETRIAAAECLEELLNLKDLEEFLFNRMCMAPLPDIADIAGAKRYAVDGGLGLVSKMLGRLDDDQHRIAHCRQAWNNLSPELFKSPDAARAFESAAVTAGAFRRFVQAGSDLKRFDSALIESLKDLQGFPNFRQVLLHWTKSFRPDRAEPKVHDYKDEIESSPVDDQGESQFKPKRISAHQALENVIKQKAAVVKMLKRGNTQSARRYVKQLIESQLRQGGTKYAVKSLCDLAQQAKEALDFSFQLELTKEAVEMLPTDGWACGQLGEAYFCLDQYDKALQFFDLAELYGEACYAQTGRARILRGQGLLEKSLAVYTKATEDFPADPNPCFGRAEVLRDMWRFDEALAVYEKAIDKFPHEKVPRCGRAAVLKELGRLEESLQVYESNILGFPKDPVSYAGRADVLKNMGRLEDAFNAYKEAIPKFPDEVILRNGLASVLKEMNKLAEALLAYDEIISSFRSNDFTLCGRAEVLKEMGRFEDAHGTYAEAIKQFPRTAVAFCGKASVLEKEGRLKDALQAYDQAILKFPREIVPWSGRAEVLKKLGNLDEALKAYEKILQRNPSNDRVRFTKAAILVTMGRYDEAEALLPHEKPQTIEEWIAYHVKGMIHLRKGSLEHAINIFQDGAQHNPWFAERQYFKSALAVASFTKNSFRESLHELGNDRTPLMDVLRIHAFGAIGEREHARQAFHRVESKCPGVLIPLRDELAKRYVYAASGMNNSDDWVIEEECRVILLRAA